MCFTPLQACTLANILALFVPVPVCLLNRLFQEENKYLANIYYHCYDVFTNFCSGIGHFWLCLIIDVSVEQVSQFTVQIKSVYNIEQCFNQTRSFYQQEMSSWFNASWQKPLLPINYFVFDCTISHQQLHKGPMGEFLSLSFTREY
jgi:hypothetical protein